MYEELVKRLRSTQGMSMSKVEFGSCRVSIEVVSKLREDAKDAADAIEELQRQNQYWETALKTALEFIPCWISVTKRLPTQEWKAREKGTDILPVLVYRRSSSDLTKFYITKAYFDGEYFIDLDDFIIDVYVTHWMPLPEPYKGEE